MTHIVHSAACTPNQLEWNPTLFTSRSCPWAKLPMGPMATSALQEGCPQDTSHESPWFCWLSQIALRQLLPQIQNAEAQWFVPYRQGSWKREPEPYRSSRECQNSPVVMITPALGYSNLLDTAELVLNLPHTEGGTKALTWHNNTLLTRTSNHYYRRSNHYYFTSSYTEMT